jgi:hypothetical protein
MGAEREETTAQYFLLSPECQGTADGAKGSWVV